MHIAFTEFKSTLLWALSGVVIGIIAFGYNYTYIASSFPGYALFTTPARFALSFFSEETAFWPKMTIFLVGQYLGYWLIIITAKRLLALIKNH
jgi:prolipoprotein diacylglyceryltransferase